MGFSRCFFFYLHRVLVLMSMLCPSAGVRVVGGIVMKDFKDKFHISSLPSTSMRKPCAGTEGNSKLSRVQEASSIVTYA